MQTSPGKHPATATIVVLVLAACAPAGTRSTASPLAALVNLGTGKVGTLGTGAGATLRLAEATNGEAPLDWVIDRAAVAHEALPSGTCPLAGSARMPLKSAP